MKNNVNTKYIPISLPSSGVPYISRSHIDVLSKHSLANDGAYLLGNNNKLGDHADIGNLWKNREIFMYPWL
jgi:hypothetical protein